jgi:hypothetical protein
MRETERGGAGGVGSRGENERREMGRAHDCENLGFCLPSA